MSDQFRFPRPVNSPKAEGGDPSAPSRQTDDETREPKSKLDECVAEARALVSRDDGVKPYCAKTASINFDGHLRLGGGVVFGAFVRILGASNPVALGIVALVAVASLWEYAASPTTDDDYRILARS